MKPFTFLIKTMGCKTNIYDSLVIENQLMTLGGKRFESENSSDVSCDVFILNSCTVTEEADRQAHREINRIKKNSPQTLTVLTGCYAEVAKEKLASDHKIELVLQNHEKQDLTRIISRRLGLSKKDHQGIPSEDSIFWGQLPMHSGKTRGFLKIQEGCNDFCTYCIIPYARGKSRSVPKNWIIDEIKRLVDLDVREIVLTGTNIADYGKDFESSLEDLIDVILDETTLLRLRLTSLDPTEITERILTRMASDDRLMPHLHVSLQSLNDQVLRAMKRHYRVRDAIAKLREIERRKSDIFIGIDLIAGFATESLAQHEQGLALLRDLPWTRLHVFPYSERAGTPATRIQHLVSVIERKRRAQELIFLSDLRHKSFVERYIDKKIPDVLFETTSCAGLDTFILGHTPNYIRVAARVNNVQTAKQLENQITSFIGKTPKPMGASHDWTLEGFLSQ